MEFRVPHVFVTTPHQEMLQLTSSNLDLNFNFFLHDFADPVLLFGFDVSGFVHFDPGPLPAGNGGRGVASQKFSRFSALQGSSANHPCQPIAPPGGANFL